MAPTQLSSHGVSVALATQPGSEADRLARQLMAREIERAHAYGDHPLVLVGTARLGKAHEADVLFVQVQSVSECGSAGCSTVSFRRTGGGWIRIMDTVGGTVTYCDIVPSRDAGPDRAERQSSGLGRCEVWGCWIGPLCSPARSGRTALSQGYCTGSGKRGHPVRATCAAARVPTPNPQDTSGDHPELFDVW